MSQVFLSSFEAMEMAINEAKKGFAHVSPNPLVGCVILDAQGRLLSKGYHQKCGGPHAEIEALKGLSPETLKGAQVFVTLEPCAHEGRTPSCAKTLAGLPIGRVVYGLVDPNPLVRGQGVEILKSAGIVCELFSDLYGSALQQELEEVCEIFLWNFRHRRVFVSLKVAVSLDGQMATSSGESKWITGEESRLEGHRLRAAHDAVLVGSGTVLADNPRLDVRHPEINKVVKAVVLDPSSRLRSLRDKLHLGQRLPEEVIWIENTRDPEVVLQTLWDQGLRSVMIEGGSQVAGAFLQANLVNRLHLFQAPFLLGEQGKSWTQFLKIPNMHEKRLLAASRSQAFGPDRYVTGLLRDPQSGESFRAV